MPRQAASDLAPPPWTSGIVSSITAEAAEGCDLEWRSAIGDGRDDEEDDRREARASPASARSPANPTADEHDQTKRRQPEHRRLPLEVGERVGGAATRRASPGRHPVPVDERLVAQPDRTVVPVSPNGSACLPLSGPLPSLTVAMLQSWAPGAWHLTATEGRRLSLRTSSAAGVL